MKYNNKSQVILNIMFSFFIVVYFTVNCVSQSSDDIYVNEQPRNVLYLTYDIVDNTLTHNTLTNDYDSDKPGNSKENSINVYINWLNPLRYKIIWTDSIVIDERDAIIRDFINLLVNLDGDSYGFQDLEKGAILKAGEVDHSNNNDSLEIRIRDLKDLDLILLLIQLRSLKETPDSLSKTEIFNINKITQNIKAIETLNIDQIPKKVNDNFKKLLEFDKYNLYVNEKVSLKQQISSFTDDGGLIPQIDNYQITVTTLLSKLSLRNPLWETYFKAAILKYLELVSIKKREGKVLLDKSNSLYEIMEQSGRKISADITRSSLEKVKIRSLGFDNGQSVLSTIVIVQTEYKDTTFELLETKEKLKQSFKFVRKDPVSIFVSAGLFYGDYSYKSFGFADDGNNGFIVTEENSDKTGPVFATFLNFHFGESRYISPLIQIGIDPTKKRPFLLLGGGFVIPSSRFSISGGPIWTWDQTLEGLSVGEVFNSTTDLEESIKYEFNPTPKGWYIGIQYEF